MQDDLATLSDNITPDSSIISPNPKRSVTFRDGFRPGAEELPDSSPPPLVRERAVSAPSEPSNFNEETAKSKKISHRSIARRVKEEQLSFLYENMDTFYVTGTQPTDFGKIEDISRENLYQKISSGEEIRVVLKRNLYVIVRKESGKCLSVF